MSAPLEPSDVFPECQPVLEVRDVQEAIDWYADKLGFDLDFAYGEPPTYACISRSFSGLGAAAFVRFTAWYRGREQLAIGGWLSIYVGNGIDELYREYTAKGVTVASELADHEYGMREFEIRDLNGHYLRFGCSLPDA